MREKIELKKRYIFFIVSICTNAFGVALITRGMLGTGPTACIPYIVSLKAPFTFGLCNFIFTFLLFSLQLIIQRRDFDRHQVLQLPVAFVYSALLDLAMFLTRDLSITHYYWAIVWTLVGCIIRALGVSLQVLADVVMLSTEAFVNVLSRTLRKNFSVIKIISDALMVMTGVFLSYYFFGNIQGVREGTLITVLVVGPVSHFFTHRLRFTNYYLENEGKFVYETKFKLKDTKRLVITITSESGSGGKIIAKILGSLLNIPVYDKELIDMVSKEGNLDKSFVRSHNERLYVNVAQAFFMENYNLTEEETLLYHKLFQAQINVIRHLTEEEDCIIVGHCANFILRDFEGAINLFITAHMDHRLSYMKERYDISDSRARTRLEQHDKDTYDYYMHFTHTNWKDSSNYHMTVDSSLFGYEGTAEVIESIIKKSYMIDHKITIKDLITKYHIENKE